MTLCYPIILPTRSTAPTQEQEPITLEEAKKQIRIGHDQDDMQIENIITQAREQLEKDTSLVCYTGTYTWKKTEWDESGKGREWFELPIKPVTALGSIAYVNTSGTSTTWSSSEYTLDTYSIWPRVRLNYGYSWPTLRGDDSGITITMTAGYASVAVIPERIKAAVKILVQYHWLLSIGENDPKLLETYELLARDLARRHYS